MNSWFSHSTRLLPALFIAASPFVRADVTLPRLLGDGLVMQRDIPNAVWGWADEGEIVTVTLDGKTVGSIVTKDGEWRVPLDVFPAGGPHRVEVRGNNRVRIENVYFGDVWVASGQSNMQLPMERIKEQYGDDIARADYPLVRMFTVPREYNFKQPQKDLAQGAWVAATPGSVLDFSAVAFYFARHLHETLGVPIGIISSNFGGSPAEGWMSEEALKAYPHYLDVAQRYRDDDYLRKLQEADRAREEAWYRNADALDAGLTGPVSWFDPSYDASDWESIDLPAFLEDEGLEPMNGVIWFKKDFAIPASEAGKPAKLMLGRMVDADTTYLNGVEVGHTTYQYPPRRYDVMENILRQGPNTITVRLISNAGRGGFVTDKPYRISTGDIKVDLTGTWRYRVGMVSEPLEPPVFLQYKQPLGFYNAMLAPLLNFSIKGVIWYQGESNTDRPAEYATLFPAMIRDWRKQWGQGDFPFLFVQLANFLEARDEPGESNWAETRYAQLQALAEPNTAMAVTIDVGEWNDIHPLNKKAVGERLALAARNLAYGEKGLVSSGPLYESMSISGSRIVLEFSHRGTGLMARGKGLKGFVIAGQDGRYVQAEAVIENDRVIVWSDEVEKPVKVRYAWADNPATANLFNREGLPASPFQTEP